MMSNWFLFYLLLAYLLGSLRFAYWVSWLWDLIPPDRFGSKNPGSTNVARQSFAAGMLTLLLDFGKCWLAMLASQTLVSPTQACYLGLAVIIGHMFPPPPCNGGKGIACWLALVYWLHWPTGLGINLIIAASAWLYRDVGLGSLISVASLFFLPPPILWQDYWLLVSFWLTQVLILLRHAMNIQMLLSHFYRKRT